MYLSNKDATSHSDKTLEGMMTPREGIPGLKGPVINRNQ
jgi:hypothetical protein